MSKRIVVISEEGRYLHADQGCLAIKRHDEVLARVPWEDLGILIIESTGTTLSASALNRVSQHKGISMLCNEQHLPECLVLPFDAHSIIQQRFALQLELSRPNKKQAWSSIVESKISLQADAIKDSEYESGLLKRAAKEVKSGDSTNREAYAAKVYWSVLWKPVTQSFRRDSQDPINSALNYSYALVRAAFARYLIASGLLPLVGIFHQGRSNPFPLADDLMEPYRPLADAWLKKTLLENPDSLNDIRLSHKLRQTLLRILTSTIPIGGEGRNFLNAIELTCESYARFLENNKQPPKFLWPERCEFLDTD